MDAEHFFARWPRRKTQAKQNGQEPPEAQAIVEQPGAQQPMPQDAPKPAYAPGISPFFARQVDEIIRRAAMKTPFADPRFNIKEGLDVCIADYNKFEPLTPEALAQLNPAEALFHPIMESKHQPMQLPDLGPQDKPNAQHATTRRDCDIP